MGNGREKHDQPQAGQSLSDILEELAVLRPDFCFLLDGVDVGFVVWSRRPDKVPLSVVKLNDQVLKL
jgi:hypothetical protein